MFELLKPAIPEIGMAPSDSWSPFLPFALAGLYRVLCNFYQKKTVTDTACSFDYDSNNPS